jgi:hypothetical protein
VAKKKRATKKKAAAKKRPVKRKRPAAKKKNAGAPKMKALRGSTGWIKGSAFRLVKKRGGGFDLLVKR